MGERLAEVHVIEPGLEGEPMLYRVQLLIHDETREALDRGDHEGWMRVIGRTRLLIAGHLADKRDAQRIR